MNCMLGVLSDNEGEQPLYFKVMEGTSLGWYGVGGKGSARSIVYYAVWFSVSRAVITLVNPNQHPTFTPRLHPSPSVPPHSHQANCLP